MTPTLIIAAFFAAPAVALAYRYWPRSRERLYAHRLGELRDDMRLRGLTPIQQAEELTFRRAMVRIRRRASDAVLRNPTGPLREIISSIAVEESRLIATKASDEASRDVARRLLKVVREAPLSDILYRDAMAAVTAAAKTRANAARLPPVSDDELAAVNHR